jgi:hypothetical protein
MPSGRPAVLTESLTARTPLVRLRSPVRTLEPSVWGSAFDRGDRRSQERRTIAVASVAALLFALLVLLLHGAPRHHQLSQIHPIAPLSTTAAAPVLGDATFYAAAFDGKAMANGATFNMDDPSITAANRWPLGTRLCVRRVAGGPWDASLTPRQRASYFGRTIEVTVEDRGAFTHALDLSRGAFAELGRLDEGVVRVAVAPAPDQSAPGSCASA